MDIKGLDRIKHLNGVVLLLVTIIASIGFLMLYGAAGGHFSPWASKQMVRFSVGMLVLVIAACIDIRTWFNISYLFYAGALFSLIAVEVLGFIGMGAQRWLDLYVISFQPSELMKIALVLALARYFHASSDEEISKTRHLFIPLLMIFTPVLLMVRQPDLTTALILTLCGVIVIFLSGVQLWKFIATGGVLAASAPFLWYFLHDYQKNRFLVFFNPEFDPSRSGYQVRQSKIALGSGELFGKGFMQGTQSHLHFLPEKQTDFIFTMFCEEFGFIGAIFLLSLYMMLILYCYSVALRTRSAFGRLLTIGLTSIFFFYMFINMAMVMGLMPVAGVPLPLVSYGGTSMLTLLLSLGIIFSARLYRDARLGGI